MSKDKKREEYFRYSGHDFLHALVLRMWNHLTEERQKAEPIGKKGSGLRVLCGGLLFCGGAMLVIRLGVNTGVTLVRHSAKLTNIFTLSMVLLGIFIVHRVRKSRTWSALKRLLGK